MKVRWSSPEGFAERLRDKIWERDLTQAEVARRVGVGRHTVECWLYDRRCPNITQACRLCDVLGCDLMWLVYGRHRE